MENISGSTKQQQAGEISDVPLLNFQERFKKVVFVVNNRSIRRPKTIFGVSEMSADHCTLVNEMDIIPFPSIQHCCENTTSECSLMHIMRGLFYLELEQN